MNTKHPELEQLFHCGRFPSYIRTLCDRLENCLKNQDNTQLESLLHIVYENSELLDFFDHYSAFIPTMDLYRRVLIIKRKLALQNEITAEIKTGTKTVLESLENYLAPPSPGNFENETLKYMVLPTAVQLQLNEKPGAVLHYIYYEPAAVPDDQWLANQFYSFKDQPQAIEYFETLVDEIKVNLFFQKRPGVRTRIDIPEIRWPHYGILFDHQVASRTYGGALMILMLLGYMETLCGSKGHGFGGYVPGTMIQAIIEPDGTLKPTNHLLIKTDAFLNEYGSHDVRLIFAEGSQEELGLKYQQGKFIIGNHSIARDKVIFVKNTAELCAAAFPQWNHLVSWVWQKLPGAYKQSLFSGLADGWSWKKIQRDFLVKPISTTAPTLFTYTTAPQFKELKTSFHYSGEYDGVFDLRFGFEKNTFLIDTCQDMVNEVVVIAIDGSSFAEPLWTRKTGKESPIAQTVYEILQNLARKDRSFYVHFLSCREPELLNITRFTNPKTLDGYLMRKQREFQLPWRGNFISPLLGYWQKRSLAAQKRMIVISSGPVYDCRDFDLNDVFWQHLWFCFNNSYKKYLPQKHITMLKDIKKNVKEKLKVIPRKITRVSIVFENWLPYEWNNPGVILKSDEIDTRTRVFVYEPREETASVILNGLFLTNSPGKTIDYEIEIKEKSGLHTVSGHLPGKESSFLQYHSHVITGQLPEDEWEIWKNFTDEPGNYICPVCYTRHKPMLKCKPLDEPIPQIIFSSLRRSRGYVILEPHKKQWFIAKTGAKIDDYYFFKMNGSVYVFCPARTSQARQVKRGSVSMGNRTFYVVE